MKAGTPRAPESARLLVVALLVAPCVMGVQCGTTIGRSAAPARLKVVAEPKGASVYVNEEYLGSARKLAQRPATLASGTHRLTIRAPGYFPHDLEVDLRSGTTTVDIELRPVPP